MKLISISFTILITLTLILLSYSIISIDDETKPYSYNNNTQSSKFVTIVEKQESSSYSENSTTKIKKELEQELENKINLIITIINSIYESNKYTMPDYALKNKIKKVINDTRYGKDGYYWINDLDKKMILHPVIPALNGKDLSYIKDSNNKYFFNDMVNLVKTQNKGSIHYVWPKPGFDKPQQKVSYVKLFEPYSWVIGTGAYIADITKELNIQTININNNKMEYSK